MPYWFLSDDIVFPHPLTGTAEGLLAVGGNLSQERLILAYSYGIFPWYGETDPILWWFPDPRCILRPLAVHVSGTMRALLRQRRFRVTLDHEFERVITLCSTVPRKGQTGTWIQPALIEAFMKLHQQGIAHSVEVWDDDKLVGGLYGVAIGKIFFGESMFSLTSNASKYGLIFQCHILDRMGFHLIDCQQDTPHMRSMGAGLISAKGFHEILAKNRHEDPGRGTWSSIDVPLHLPV